MVSYKGYILRTTDALYYRTEKVGKRIWYNNKLSVVPLIAHLDFGFNNNFQSKYLVVGKVRNEIAVI